MLINVWSYKGGVGKSTISSNLARALQMTGKSVALVDADPQGSLLFFRDTAPDYPIPIYQYGTDDIPDDIEILVADFPPAVDGKDMIQTEPAAIIVPMLPSVLDYHAAMRGIESIPKGTVPIIPVLNAYDPRSPSEQAVKDKLISQFPNALVMPRRSAFRRAMNARTTVFDMPLDAGNSAARAAILELADLLPMTGE